MGQRSFQQPSLQAHSLVKLHPFATTGLVGSKGQMNGHVIPLILAAQKKTAQVARKRKVVLPSQHERAYSVAHWKGDESALAAEQRQRPRLAGPEKMEQPVLAVEEEPVHAADEVCVAPDCAARKRRAPCLGGSAAQGG
jgi:hypothetical protein